MQVFKANPERFNEIKKQMFRRMVFTFSLAIISVTVINLLKPGQENTDIYFILMFIPIVAISLIIGLKRRINRQKEIYLSYTLTITNNLITRKQKNTPGISIYFNDVVEISKHKSGSFTIKGTEPTDIIEVPAQIEDHAQLESTLEQIQFFITEKKPTLVQKYQGIVGLLTLGMMLCVYTVNNKIVIAISGPALIAFMIWSLIKIQRSKNVDRKSKRAAWWIVFVLASIIYLTIMKLIGQPPR